jgi:hypothetical protein
MSDLRFRVQTANGAAYEVSVAANATIGHLLQAISAAIPQGLACTTVMYKESAFPPKWSKLPVDPSLSLASVPLKTNTILQANVPSASLSPVKTGSKTTPNTPMATIARTEAAVDLTRANEPNPFEGGETNAPTRPRRQAAVNADGVIAAMIKAQESMIAGEKAARASAKPVKVSSPQQPRGFGTVVGLRGSTTAARPHSTPQPGMKRVRPFAGGFGQLHRVKRPRRRTHMEVESGEDIADPMSMLAHRMMVAVSSSSRGGDPLMSFFRSAAQKAVASQYEISRAVRDTNDIVGYPLEPLCASASVADCSCYGSSIRPL